LDWDSTGAVGGDTIIGTIIIGTITTITVITAIIMTVDFTIRVADTTGTITMAEAVAAEAAVEADSLRQVPVPQSAAVFLQVAVVPVALGRVPVFRQELVALVPA
jgi:hypothetical protein